MAAMNGNKDMCKVLVTEHGAQVDVKNLNGFTAYDLAEAAGTC